MECEHQFTREQWAEGYPKPELVFTGVVLAIVFGGR